MNIFETDLPDNWTKTTLREILTSIKGKKPKKLGEKDDFFNIPYISIKSFEKGIFEHFTDGENCRICNKEDILMVWDGARCGLVGTGVYGAIGSTLAKLNYFEMNRNYLFHFLQFNYGYINKRPRGVGIPHVEPEILWNIEIPIPPFSEQDRISNKIEELFTKLDAGIQDFILAKEKLKIYRQSILKNAFEGKLTEEWREIHKKDIESVSIILEKLKNERKKTFGKKYKKTTQIETSELPELPKGWAWTNIESLAEVVPNAIKAGPFGSALKKAFYVPEGYKIYGQEQVIRNNPYYGDYFIDEDRFKSLKSCKVKPGDVLISLVGTIGKVLILPEDIEPGIINPRLVKFSLDERIVNNKFIKIYLESTAVRHFFSIASHGGTMDILNLTILKNLPISLPPLQEQNVLIDEIEQKFIIIDEIEREIDLNVLRAQKLRQSILKKAFMGQLVPQNPDDEPAKQLLERIKAEKEKQKPQRKTRKSKQKRLI